MSSEPLFKSFGKKLVYIYLTKSLRLSNYKSFSKMDKEWKRKNRFSIITSFNRKK